MRCAALPTPNACCNPSPPSACMHTQVPCRYVLKLQAVVRTGLAQHSHTQLRVGIRKLQALMRSASARRAYVHARTSAQAIEAAARRLVARRMYGTQLAAEAERRQQEAAAEAVRRQHEAAELGAGSRVERTAALAATSLPSAAVLPPKREVDAATKAVAAAKAVEESSRRLEESAHHQQVMKIVHSILAATPVSDLEQLVQEVRARQ